MRRRLPAPPADRRNRGRDHTTPLDETIDGLERLKADGKIRHYGVSNFNVDMMQECQQYGTIAANQVGYHMFDRRMEHRILPWCLANGVGFMSYGSLGFGLLTGALAPDHTFEEGDWRRNEIAFELPLFERETFARELEVTRRLAELADGYGHSVAQLQSPGCSTTQPSAARSSACATRASSRKTSQPATGA